MLDNDAISKMSVLTGLSTSFTDINVLTAQLVSGVTQPIRFNGCLYEGIKDYTSHLVPYKQFKFLASSFGPFTPLSQQNEASPSIAAISESFCDPVYNMAGLDPLKGKMMSCCL
jgi:hypothetical protein